MSESGLSSVPPAPPAPESVAVAPTTGMAGLLSALKEAKTGGGPSSSGDSDNNAAEKAFTRPKFPALPQPGGPGMIRLGGGLGGIGGMGGIGAGGGFPKLKKRQENLKFVDYDLTSFAAGDICTISANDRLRSIDKLHMHNPHADECKQLNIPNSRLDLTVMKNILFLCGGCVGGRFESEDIRTIQHLTQLMGKCWVELENHYAKLTNATKKLILKSEPHHPAHATTSSSTTAALADKPASATTATATAATSGSPITASVTAAGASATGDGTETEALIVFHKMADDYLELAKSLQALVRRKQKEVEGRTDNNGTDFSKIDADPEGKMGLPIPAWLTTLIDKYKSAAASESNYISADCVDNSTLAPPFAALSAAVTTISAATETTGAFLRPTTTTTTQTTITTITTTPTTTGGEGVRGMREGKITVTVGKLAVFLSGCVLGRVQCTKHEAEAMNVLLQASNDCQTVFTNSQMEGSLRASGAERGGSSGSSSGSGVGSVSRRGAKYWAKRLFDFLSKMTELKTMIKDSKALDALE